MSRTALVNDSELEQLRKLAEPIQGRLSDYNPLLARIGSRRFVLIGEASHGTHEFYLQRAIITKRLVEEKGFDAVVCEADWPDMYAANKYCKGKAAAAMDARDALGSFQRFPTWMWRNSVMETFVTWLRRHNDEHPDHKVGLYGMDLYSLNSSMEAVLKFLAESDPEAERSVREQYECFSAYGGNPQEYGFMTTARLAPGCQRQVMDALVKLREATLDSVRREEDGGDGESTFAAEMNAEVVVNAEKYYREMFYERDRSWNVRDTHMVDTVDRIAEFITKRLGRPARLVVWAHNSHLGDARATEVSRHGQLNVGQLMRERHGDDTYVIGFSTHTGSVAAAERWGGQLRKQQLRPSLPTSVERVLHDVAAADYVLPLRNDVCKRVLNKQGVLTRAVGVIYRPMTERGSHYFDALPADQFDEVIHWDLTHPVAPLDQTPDWGREDAPMSTFPFGV